jgi:hypothetical protein
MKILRKIMYACVLTFSFASCTKQEAKAPEPIPTVHVTDTILTQEKLIGKWEVTQVSEVWAAGIEASLMEWIKDHGEFSEGNKTKEWEPDLDISYIVFSSNATFVHTDINGAKGSYMLGGILPNEGKWNLPERTKAWLTSNKLYSVPPTVYESEWLCSYKDSTITLFREVWNPLSGGDSSLTQHYVTMQRIPQ